MLRDFQVRRKETSTRYFDHVRSAFSLAREIDQTPYLKTRPESYPDLDIGTGKHAILEINNTCNIDCLSCRTSLASRKKGMILDETLTRTLDEYARAGIRSVALHTIGDPFMFPRLGIVFQELRKRGMTSALSTNGLLLYRHVDTLIEYFDVCSSIRFSVDGAEKDTYERIRFGGRWEDLLENLELARTKLTPRGFTINFTMVMSKDNFHEVGKYIELFRRYVRYPQDNFLFSFINSLSPDPRYFDTVNLLESHTNQNKMCEFGSFKTPFTFFDGPVSVCCRDYDGSLVVGDLKENSLDEIRADRLTKKFRQAHESGDLTDYPLCRSCNLPDPRLVEVFRHLMRYFIFDQPKERASHYQEKADLILDAFQEKHEVRNKLESNFPSLAQSLS
jgi:MoaA/NifB/PqqE/SkfB family radical SAM enzyme